MRVITRNPIVVRDRQHSNIFGVGKKNKKKKVYDPGLSNTPTSTTPSGPMTQDESNSLVWKSPEAKKEYETAQKTKNKTNLKEKAEKAKGIFDKAKDIFGFGAQESVSDQPSAGGYSAPADSKKGMSTTTKVLIGAGVVGAILAVVYFSRKPKTAKA